MSSFNFSGIFNNAMFKITETGGILTIKKKDVESIMDYSNSSIKKIEYDTFISLFENNNANRGIYVILNYHNNENSYNIELLKSNSTSASFNLLLSSEETHNLKILKEQKQKILKGRMNLYVDEEINNNLSDLDYNDGDWCDNKMIHY